MYVCICALSTTLPAAVSPTTVAIAVERAGDQFSVSVYSNVISSRRGCCCAAVVVSSGLLAILHLLFSISHFATTTTIAYNYKHRYILGIHTNIPELTSNRQRLYFIISFACRRQLVWFVEGG